MNLSDLLVPTFRNMLGSLSAWLGKAEGDAVMAARLAPDMFPLATQVRFACVQAREAVHRLKGEPFPAELDALLNEGRTAGDAPGTIADAQARIAETLAFLDAVVPAALDGDETRAIEHALPMGLTFDMTAGEYARDWSLAQFYFHVMTAYAILRREGVTLGKGDYVAHCLGYLRSDAPAST